jgi:hypothetical protein
MPPIPSTQVTPYALRLASRGKAADKRKTKPTETHNAHRPRGPPKPSVENDIRLPTVTKR